MRCITPDSNLAALCAKLRLNVLEAARSAGAVLSATEVEFLHLLQRRLSAMERGIKLRTMAGHVQAEALLLFFDWSDLHRSCTCSAFSPVCTDQDSHECHGVICGMIAETVLDLATERFPNPNADQSEWYDWTSDLRHAWFALVGVDPSNTVVDCAVKACLDLRGLEKMAWQIEASNIAEALARQEAERRKTDHDRWLENCRKSDEERRAEAAEARKPTERQFWDLIATKSASALQAVREALAFAISSSPVYEVPTAAPLAAHVVHSATDEALVGFHPAGGTTFVVTPTAA